MGKKNKTINQGYGPSIRSVVLEKLANYIILLPCCLISLVLWAIDHQRLFLNNFITPIISVAAFLIGLIGFAFWLRGKIGRGQIRFFLNDFGKVFLNPYQAIRQFFLGIIIYAFIFAMFYTAAKTLHIDLELIEALAIIPLVHLAMSIPFSISGWGIRETAAYILWSLYSDSGEQGLAIAFVYGIIVLISTLPGWPYSLLRR